MLIGALILLNAFFAASEIAIVSVRKTRIKQLAEDERNRGALAILRLTESPGRFLATIQVGVTFAGFFASALGAISAVALLADVLSRVPVGFIAHAASPIALILVTSAISFVTLILGELVPKNLAIQYAEQISLFVARPIEWIARLSAPIIFILTGTTNLILAILRSEHRAQLPSITEDEIRSMVEAAEEEGVVEPSEGEMIQGIFDFGETRVREIMVPRVDISAIEKTATIEEARKVFLEEGYSRIPVYEESLDNIVGILYVKDMIKFLEVKKPATPVTEIMRPAIFVPESKNIGDLLKELRQSRSHMAIVVDEYGGTAGLVTLEDLIEEIVGEIHDEYDMREEAEIEILSETEAIADARISLDTLNQSMSLDLQAENVDTLGGVIYSQLGRIPTEGEKVVLPDVTLEVLSLEGQRIRKVRVLRQQAEPEENLPVKQNGAS